LPARYFPLLTAYFFQRKVSGDRILGNSKLLDSDSRTRDSQG